MNHIPEASTTIAVRATQTLRCWFGSLGVLDVLIGTFR